MRRGAVGRPGEEALGDGRGRRRCRCGHGESPSPTNHSGPRVSMFLMMILHSAGSRRCMIIIRIAPGRGHDVAARGSEARAVRPSIEHDRRAAHPARGRSRTVKASERVAQEIVRDIVRRGLETGDRLPLEAAMVEEYGVSRTSLREALRLLEVQGLISLKPGPGGGPGRRDRRAVAPRAHGGAVLPPQRRHLRRPHAGPGSAGVDLRPAGGPEPGSASAHGTVARAGPSRTTRRPTATSPPASTAPCTGPPPTRC